MTVHVTEHAIDRYVERIAFVDRETARSRIAAAARGIQAAAAFGAHVVRTADCRLMVDGLRVVTVLPRNVIDHSDLTLAQRRERFAMHRARHDQRDEWGGAW